MKILFFQDESELLTRLCLSRPFGPTLVQWLRHNTPFGEEQARALLPEHWLETNPDLKRAETLTYRGMDWTVPEFAGSSQNGRIYLFNAAGFLTIDEVQFDRILDAVPWDVAFIQVCPDLQPSREVLKLTPRNQVVGFRRFYTVTAEPSSQPNNLPHMVVLKTDAWRKLTGEGRLPLDFRELSEAAHAINLQTVSLKAGGCVTSLNDPAGVLNCLDALKPNGTVVPSHCKAIGPVFIGQDVSIEPNVTLIGPVVLSDGAKIGSGAVIRRSLIGEHYTVRGEELVNNRLCLDPENRPQAASTETTTPLREPCDPLREFRHWPRFSYVRFGKRIFDIVSSFCVLILLIPVFPIVMLMIKITSPGPVFYKARRQGLHGREFNCLKFRTMMIKADSIQERLRVVNQVDGPQFKIDNDPRISGVGKFLRDTCIDELPQFINVLLGQMSVVGPRPSPENENDSCPLWRDARLSVRPGITGLWQVCRTRQTGSDFQEWVYYDTRYVRNLSFRKDLWICWKTAKKLIREFLGQFG